MKWFRIWIACVLEWRRRKKRERIERKYKRIYLRTCDMFGDDRSRSFQWFVTLQAKKNKELRRYE